MGEGGSPLADQIRKVVVDGLPISEKITYYQFAEIGMIFPNTVYCCLLLGMTDMARASDSGKSTVLMLDTRNLKSEKEHWGNGKDYLVSLAKDNNRAPLPSQFTICNSYFALGAGGENFYYKILNDPMNGPWMRLQGWPDSDNLETKTLVVVVNGGWYFPGTFGSLYFNKWYHICLAVDLQREVIHSVGDGVVLNEIEVKGLRKGAPKSLDGRLILDDTQLTRHNYMVGNVQVFTGILSNEEMISITAGKDCGRDGD